MIRKVTPHSGVEPDDGKVAVTFELPATVWASEVAVVGEFNGWDPTVHRLVQQPDGSWRLSLQLDRHQTYQFRYLVDRSAWLNDWWADEYVPTRSGGFISVLRT